MIVIVSADANEAKNAIIASLPISSPVYIRLSRERLTVITKPDEKFEVGKAKVLTNGKDCLIISCGVMVYKTLVAYEMLRQDGIECTVVNLHTIKPIDEEVIVSLAKKCGCVVTCEEHQVYGRLGSAVAEVLAKNYPVIREFVGINDKFGESDSAEDLMIKYKLKSQNIVEKVKKVIKQK